MGHARIPTRPSHRDPRERAPSPGNAGRAFPSRLLAKAPAADPWRVSGIRTATVAGRSGGIGMHGGGAGADRPAIHTTIVITGPFATSPRTKPGCVCRNADANAEGGPWGERHGWRESICF